MFVVAASLGFMVFPFVQPNAKASNLWDATCSPAGVLREPSGAKPIEPAFKGVVGGNDLQHVARDEPAGRFRIG